MENKIKYIIIFIAILTAIPYLALSFAYVSFSISDWSPTIRYFTASMWIMGMVIGIVSIFQSDNN